MRDLRGTWPQALTSLVGAMAMILAIRWAFFEPYVIPSGSMIPTLLVHDHILVNKLAYGIRVPFTSKWLIKFTPPKRGEVVVFKSVEDPSVFIVKRVIGIEGDEVKIISNGQILLNGVPLKRNELTRIDAELRIRDWPQASREEYLERFEFFEEFPNVVNRELNLEFRGEHLTLRARSLEEQDQGPYLVGKGELFMMGDNRDNSSDSRIWGALPIERILGRASSIWLSCEETLPDANQLCDPKTMRWKRMLSFIR